MPWNLSLNEPPLMHNCCRKLKKKNDRKITLHWTIQDFRYAAPRTLKFWMAHYALNSERGVFRFLSFFSLLLTLSTSLPAKPATNNQTNSIFLKFLIMHGWCCWFMPFLFVWRNGWRAWEYKHVQTHSICWQIFLR